MVFFFKGIRPNHAPDRTNNFLIFFLSFITFLLGFAALGFAAQVTLGWDSNSESDLAGYKIYVGYQSNSYSWNIDAGNSTQAVVGGLVEGTPYFLALTAYNQNGLESGFSNEVTYTPPTPSSNQFTLSVNRAGTGSGTVTSNPTGSTFNVGTQVTLTAAPDAGSTFTGWSGACSGTGTCTVVMNANVSVTASFNSNTLTLTATAGSNGTITPSGSKTVQSGASQSYTITPNTGYQIADVKVDGASVGAVSVYTFSAISASHTISATFTAQVITGSYTLNIRKDGTGSGTITHTPAGLTFSSGTQVTLTASPNASSSFVGWSGACTGTAHTCTVTMNSKKTVTATFKIGSTSDYKYKLYLPLIN
jgi:hypothetical protein